MARSTSRRRTRFGGFPRKPETNWNVVRSSFRSSTLHRGASFVLDPLATSGSVMVVDGDTIPCYWEMLESNRMPAAAETVAFERTP